MKSGTTGTNRSVVAVTKGSRWEAKKVIREGLELLGGIGSIVKKGDTVVIKPNMGYPEPPGMPAWICLTDEVVLVALTELFLEAGAKRVVTGDGCAHAIKAAYMFKNSGLQQAIEKAGGEILCFDEEPFITREVPGGTVLKKQAIPKIVTEAEVFINVPKIKTTQMGNWTLGFKNLFGLIPQEERLPWHRIPEHFFLLTDLCKLVKPTLTVMDGFIIQEGAGPRWGNPVDLGVVVMGKDPVATEAVAVSVIGHKPYQQQVLPIADKQSLGTSRLSNIEVRGQSVESVKIYSRPGPGEQWVNRSPNIIEYIGGACWGCGFWIQFTPYPWEIDASKKYALVVGNMPKIPEKFTEDEVIVLGSCAMRDKDKIEKACPAGVTPQFMGGCPPYAVRKPGYMKLENIENLPFAHPTNYV
ncbi:DUF362 domain-containing protein [Chloroflexota bacterium]